MRRSELDHVANPPGASPEDRRPIRLDIDRLLDQIDLFRVEATRILNSPTRNEMGQFLTPMVTARQMASTFGPLPPSIHLLDAGAGVGSLSAAFVAQALLRAQPPLALSATAYEIDPVLATYLRSTLSECATVCQNAGCEFSWRVLEEDFVAAGTAILREDLFSPGRPEFNAAILNPPYGKIHSQSQARQLLRTIGVETSNIYTGFLAVVAGLLGPGGQLVAITPRSFANGPYFRPFRQHFLGKVALRTIHVFDSREAAFRDDGVLQENIVFLAERSGQPGRVLISSSPAPDDESIMVREVDYDQVVSPVDPDSVIHIVPDAMAYLISQRMKAFDARLTDLGLSVSTGRVVDFRALEFLRSEHATNTAPLIYPAHFGQDGFIGWPSVRGRKPNALVIAPKTQDQFVSTGTYVLVKRFSAKEERRRIVAAVYDPARLPETPIVAFENHLNYFHSGGRGLPERLARGLAAFLNCTLVDEYFRQRSGHTQVNASDLRSLGYPTARQLEALGGRIGDAFPAQDVLDRLVEEELLQMASGPNPVRTKQRIAEARKVLQSLGLPKAQQNDRSALVLLALLDLTPDKEWPDAIDPLVGITPMMQFVDKHYGKTYAPNTRETVRRQTVHQFIQAGIVVQNPDDPTRPINSGKNVYQVEGHVLDLLRKYDTPDWNDALISWLESVETLKQRYAQERSLQRIPVSIAEGHEILLSPGGQNVLVKEIIDEFCPRFTPGGELLYVGDTDTKWAHFDARTLSGLGVEIDQHGKMPDVVVYYRAKDWLVLIEAVTSHGPVDPKRRAELQELFARCTAGLVYVTAFRSRHTMSRYLTEISWETEVWVSDSPSHLIHFNGERFLGPY